MIKVSRFHLPDKVLKSGRPMRGVRARRDEKLRIPPFGPNRAQSQKHFMWSATGLGGIGADSPCSLF